jgi:hypothetical protein
VFWKTVSIALILCVLAACSRNVEPGDAQYPKLNTKPVRTLDVTLIGEKSLRPVFRTWWWAENQIGPWKDACTYRGSRSGVPARVGYSITVPLLFSNEDGALRSHFAFDLYEPGYCGYQFGDLNYNIEPSYGGSFLPLIEYKDDPKLPPAVSVDIWCRHLADLPEDACDTYSTQTKTRPAPVAVGPNTHSLVMRVHDARINSP